MEFEFRLPDVGEGITESELLEWHVAPGQTLEEDAPLCEIETDKAVVEIPVPCSGTLLRLVGEVGETLKVGQVIAVFETEKPPRQQFGHGVAEAAPVEPVAATEEPATPAAVANTAGRVAAAPSTRRYAREQGVDVNALSGSGPKGRVVRDDVDASRPAAAATPAAPPLPISDEARVIREPLKGMRKRMAERMVLAKTRIPEVTTGYRAKAGEFVALRNRLNAKSESRISYTAMMIKALIPALKMFPYFNASIDEESNEIITYRDYNIGVAVYTDAGLVVPVIRNADQKSIVELSDEIGELASLAKERKLSVAQMQGGTYTLTNTGSHSKHDVYGTPVINYPEAAIFGMGRIANEPVAINDTDIEVQKIMHLVMTYDHRLIDGVTAMMFAEVVIELIEDPSLLLLHG
ncbi:MAG: 2-oxo acid dehydrogenase subunit E2 [Gammaproteobacteria bacterium]|nr:2-oxo acid dehydrogenase subunit E2 [Gammaproteobacteria bacterium]